MNDYANGTLERTADLGSYDVPRLGTDASGAVHYYDDANDRMLVARDGDIEHVEPLDGRPIADWIAFVDRRRGWRAHGDAEFLAQLERIGAAADA